MHLICDRLHHACWARYVIVDKDRYGASANFQASLFRQGGSNRQKTQAAKRMIPGVLCSVGCFLAANEPSALGRATQAFQRLQQSTFSISSEAGQPQQPPRYLSQSVVQTMN